MPISPLALQRRHAELGRIRIGHKVDIGNGRSRPAKLDRFRFTSPQERLIRDIAALYGGEAKKWSNGSKDEWEVYTEARSIPVIAVKGGMSQWMETWSGGGCIHRCEGVDGGRSVIDDSVCDPEQWVQSGKTRLYPHRDAKPTTRLSVMLRDVESLGVWRLETHGWNAAAEIPAMAELAQYVGDLVPAVLSLTARTSVKDGKTSQYVVPVLDLAIQKQRLVEIVAAQTGAGASLSIESGAPQGLPQLTAGPAVDYLALAGDATTVDEVRGIWQQAHDAGRLTPDLDAELQAVAGRIGQAQAPQIAATTPTEATAAAEEDPGEPEFSLSADQGEARAPADASVIWSQIVAEAGEHGWSTSQLAEAFDGFRPGVAIADASAWALEDFLAKLRAGQIERSAA